MPRSKTRPATIVALLILVSLAGCVDDGLAYQDDAAEETADPAAAATCRADITPYTEARILDALEQAWYAGRITVSDQVTLEDAEAGLLDLIDSHNLESCGEVANSSRDVTSAIRRLACLQLKAWYEELDVYYQIVTELKRFGVPDDVFNALSRLEVDILHAMADIQTRYSNLGCTSLTGSL